MALPLPTPETPAYTSTPFDANMYQKQANTCAYRDSCGRCASGYGELNVHDFSRYNDTLHQQFYKTCEQSKGTVETSDEKGVHCEYPADSAGKLPSPDQVQILRNTGDNLRFSGLGATGFETIISAQILYCHQHDMNPIKCANDLATRVTFT